MEIKEEIKEVLVDFYVVICNKRTGNSVSNP